MAWWSWWFRPRPTPPPAPPPAPVVCRWSVWTADGLTTAGTATLEPDQYPGLTVVGQPEGGRWRFTLPADAHPWGAWAHLTGVEGYNDVRHRVVIGPDLMDVQLTPVARLPRLRATGKFFETAQGQPWTMVACTDFQLFQRYLAGEDIAPVLAQRRDCGFTTVRVLGSCHYMFALSPLHDPARYDAAILPFLALCARHDLYVEWTAFADTQVVFPDGLSQLRYWQRLAAILPQAPNVLCELVNEHSQHQNGVFDVQAFTPIPGVLCSHGSNGSSEDPVLPAWDYVTIHWNDAFEWQRKTSHNTMEYADLYGVPAVANENTRFPDRCASLDIARTAAEAAALLCAGATFHAVRGKASQPWDGHELACATAWADGARHVPLAFQRGAYRRYDEGRPDVLRTYSRTLSDGREYVVRIAT